MIMRMHGSATRISTVALIKPNEMLIAIGIRNFAWNDVSSINGVNPSIVVIVVRKMGRKRCRPASMIAS